MKIPKYLKLGRLLSVKAIQNLEDGTVVYYKRNTNALYETVHCSKELAVKRGKALQTPFGGLLVLIWNVYDSKFNEAEVYEVLD